MEPEEIISLEKQPMFCLSEVTEILKANQIIRVRCGAEGAGAGRGEAHADS